jgi:hypothetical protein
MRSSTPEAEAPNIAHVKTRVLEASSTRQQTSDGSDLLEFVMNELAQRDWDRNILGSGAVWRPCVKICSGLLETL